jgi:serine protease
VRPSRRGRDMVSPMRRVLGVLASAAVGAGLALFGTAAPAAAGPPTGRLIVTVRPGEQVRARIGALERALGRLGAVRAGAAVPEIGMVPVALPAGGGSPAALGDRLRALPGVVSVDLERRLALRYVPNDPALTVDDPAPGAPAGMTIEWWPARSGLPVAWDFDRGAGTKVAVIDTGIDGAHPEFAGRILDSVDLDSSPNHGPATTDDVGHGTHVASLACGAGDNAIGLTGAGLGCSMLVVKTDLTEGSVAQGIVWATDHGAQAINMSFGNDDSRPAPDFLVNAINYAYGHEVVMVTTARNEPVGEQSYPADILQPTGTGGDLSQGKGITVTAANFYDQRASFAGFGSQISMAAYGSVEVPDGPTGIFGAYPGNHTELEDGSIIPLEPPPCGCRFTFNGDSRYAYLEGTSAAAPMVSAVAALVRQLNPDLGAADVIRLLKETARRPAGTGWTGDLGWGILDAGAALLRARTIDRRAPASRLRAPSRVRSRRFVVRFWGHDLAPKGVKRSGIVRYEVWRSANGARPRRIATTRRNSVIMRALPGSRYAFYTIAVDRAGNREAVPKRPDARVRALRRRG